ncbi:hypothetical protein 2050HW_00276 [Serratia phage vB_SmaM_ 2050HW]|uniref:Uncharacterized protein n=1 Tax=Serratia phage vB_SmaM_ 2050HW TaxID=2024252 RepID=A0A289YVY9_9CAUD|nr:hypothetical protein HWB23_gp276 [Serratia phage vB_SmaM_ 2050HW]ATA65611.1 hypothetical protein 2050HW_00276 [Serratia phage vB_SmaM_ 2050HW]UCR74551.1 hypothetical protein [Serratia phage BUCT660]UGO54226.1 hypothetical protein HAYMO_244 [Serratia phage vB_SmaM_Haymo]URG14122.1 hypothetical protein [Pectobacterium phage vB_ParM-25]
MAINFTEKQTRSITAARIAGLVQALAHEVAMFGRDPQTLLETEYLPLYSQLQDLGFNAKGDIKWMLLQDLERSHGIAFHKTDLGFGFQFKGLTLEVASKIEAQNSTGGKDFPSVIRNREAKYKGYEVVYAVATKTGSDHAIVRA